MLLGLLSIDPEKRYKLRDIKSHVWFRQATEAPLLPVVGIKVGTNNIPVDMQVLSQLKDYN